jgi:ATP-dependent helicase Lhr and Lhr-like helicase
VPLTAFTPLVRDWFANAFEAPTPAQSKAWPAIATGENVLISAPTGSGKTLAAFLWGLDRFVAASLAGADPDQHRTRLLYVSPLKALSYDVERNLRAPLRGLGLGEQVRVAIRTGDTPARERAAMLRRTPDILITTPESLYLMLTSQAREILTGVEAVIVDEIHAVAATKRGAHLALTLERLEAGLAGAPLQRIGLSATQRPLEEVARFMVGPMRRATIVDVGATRPLDIEIRVPVESMVEPDRGVERDPLEPVVGGEATRRSIWPAIYPQLLELVRTHRSTIVFVNSRRAAERLALRLNELAAQGSPPDGAPASQSAAPAEIARAHHGSLAREERTTIEEMLKAGELPCLVATSSLELGIDMGAVDLVIQVESPKSVSRGLQRIGRSGHGVGATSKGRIFPKFRADLLECAVVVRSMREGRIEPTVVPRNALDVLAQQIVAIAAGAESVAVDDLYALVTRTYSYAELSRELLENVLDMLDGRYPSSEFGELRPRISWDRLAGTIRARKGARQLAVVNAGTIPDRGLFAVTLPDGRRVGELDEEMVYEARPGQTFLLGATAWRIEEIGRDRVIVTPAPGAPGAVPFWRGDSVGRPKELGEAIGAFSRWAVSQPPEVLQREYDLDPLAAANLLEFLGEQQAATGVIPSDRTIVIERFRDEIGDWRLCVLTPFGGRIHAAWGLALSARIRERYGLESDAIWSDDGIIVHLPDTDEPPTAELVLPEPDELEELIVGELAASALFGARFRENAARALLIPRAYPGRRTPLWQQRLKAQTLLEVARRYPDFPIILETYRECLRDVLDVSGLESLLRALSRREISLVEVETATASPFASSLLFDYVATYMYEGDAPNAERRAAALSLDRELLRELLGQEELRELIDAGALDALEADLARRSPTRQAASRDELHDVLRTLGDLSAEQIRERVLAELDCGAMLADLVSDRRVVAVRVAREPRFIAAQDAGLYRDALGVVPPSGLPEAFLADVPDALRELAARHARTDGPFTTAELSARYGVDMASALRELEGAGRLVRGELRPVSDPRARPGEREWCDPEVLRRLRRASLAVLRREIEPAERRALAVFLPSWQGVDRHAAAGAGVERLREVIVALQGLALPAELWESAVLPRRVGAYSTSWLDQLCAAGEIVWVGAGAIARRSGRVALYFRDDAPAIGPPAATARLEAPAAPEHELIRERLRAAPCFFSDLLAEIDAPVEALQEALWDLVWAGEITNDAWAPLRAPRLALARAASSAAISRGGGGRAGAARSGRRFAPSMRASRAQTRGPVQGRWSLTATLFEPLADPLTRRRTLAELLLERYGIVTRELVLAEGIQGGFAALYDSLAQLETLGVCRRGYFIEGLGGAQFALPGAVERLRAQRDLDHAPPIVLAASDPAQPFGAALAWPPMRGAATRPDGQAGGEGRRAARVAGAHVVLVGADVACYAEAGGRGLQTFVTGDPLRVALSALADAVRAGQIRKLELERVDGEPVLGSPIEPLLVELGFRSGPRRLTLSA